MSKFSYSEVTCPECNKTQKVKVWDSINVNLDPEQKENIMSGKLFEFTCDECGFTTRVQYPCLYHDMDKSLMIYCIPNFSADTKSLDKMLNRLKIDSPEHSMENYKFRIVKDTNKLLEKIRIFDEELDDRVIEIIKIVNRAFFLKKYPDKEIEDILFNKNSEGSYISEFLIKDGNIAFMPISQEMIDVILDKHKELLEEKNKEEGFSLIDEVWAYNKVMDEKNHSNK